MNNTQSKQPYKPNQYNRSYSNQSNRSNQANQSTQSNPNNQNNQANTSNQNNQANQSKPNSFQHKQWNNKFKPQENKGKQYSPRQTVSEIWISPSQVKNPIWSILKVPFKINEQQMADFILPESNISVVFLSLQFHQNYPLYIDDKLDKFAKSDDAKVHWNKILLCLFDAEDTNNQLMDITILCIEKGMKLLVGFSFSEIANYLASLKYIEKHKSGYMKDKPKVQ